MAPLTLVIYLLSVVAGCIVGWYTVRPRSRSLSEEDVEAITTAVWDRIYRDPMTGDLVSTAQLLAKASTAFEQTAKDVA